METNENENTFRSLARSAKKRIKNGFWKKCEKEMSSKIEEARRQGLNESKAGRYLVKQVSSRMSGEKEDEFYIKVKKMLDEEGETSNAIGRLTDYDYYNTLSYEEKQRYTLSISEKYLRALEKYRKEKEFLFISNEKKL